MHRSDIVDALIAEEAKHPTGAHGHVKVEGVKSEELNAADEDDKQRPPSSSRRQKRPLKLEGSDASRITKKIKRDQDPEDSIITAAQLPQSPSPIPVEQPAPI